MKYRLLRLFGADGEGDDGSDDGNSQSGSSDGDGDGGEGTSRTITNDELDRMVARAADRAQRKARKDLASSLGFEKVGDLEEWAKSTREAQDAKKSEDEKAREQLAKDTTAAAQARKDAQAERLQVRVERAIVRSGITDDGKLDRLRTLVGAEIDGDSDEESWNADIETALDAVRKDVPELFTGAKKSHGSGDGGSRDGSSDDGADEESEAMKELEKEYGERRGTVTRDFSQL